MKSIGLEREIKLRFASVGEARDAILAHGRDAGPRPPAPGGLPARHRRRAAPAAAVRPARPDRAGPQPPDVQGPGPALADEAARGAGDGRWATAKPCCACSRSWASHVWFRYQKYREEFGYEDVDRRARRDADRRVRRDRGERAGHRRHGGEALGRTAAGLPRRLVSRPLREALRAARHAGWGHAVR